MGSSGSYCLQAACGFTHVLGEHIVITKSDPNRLLIK